MKNKITVNHEGSFHIGRKGIKIPAETKLKYAKLCVENTISKSEAARQLGASDGDVLSWVYRYIEQGELAFLDTGKNNVYSDELRLQAVQSYLRGEIEKLQIENERLKHELYMMKMERDLLKKVKELERKDLYRK